MNIREGQNSRKVSFDTREDLGDKIDKLAVMISKLAAKDSGKVRPFISQIHQNRLQIPPRKCQLFRTILQCMGNGIFIQNTRVCVKPLRSRLEAIQRWQPPQLQ